MGSLGWGDRSVSKVLPVQMWRPEFAIQHHERAERGSHVLVIPARGGGAEIDGSPRLNGQPV